eukprot:5771097-Amphidinium_carterae.1
MIRQTSSDGVVYFALEVTTRELLKWLRSVRAVCSALQRLSTSSRAFRPRETAAVLSASSVMLNRGFPRVWVCHSGLVFVAQQHSSVAPEH